MIIILKYINLNRFQTHYYSVINGHYRSYVYSNYMSSLRHDGNIIYYKWNSSSVIKSMRFAIICIK